MSLSGIWNLSIATPLGEQKVELELVQAGPDEISGVSRNELEGELPLQDPVLKDNRLTWKTTITRPIKVTATMQLTFTGDTATGTARAGVFPAAKITGRRAS
jgi:hypothetical protein